MTREIKSSTGKAELSRTDFFEFICKDGETMDRHSAHTAYYMTVFDEYYNGKSRFVCWNWSAGLLGAFWFFYRRMYLYGFLTLFVYSSMIGIPLWGLMGNSIYFHHIKKKIYGEGKRRGGVSLVVPIAAAVLTLVLFAFSFKHMTSMWYGGADYSAAEIQKTLNAELKSQDFSAQLTATQKQTEKTQPENYDD